MKIGVVVLLVAFLLLAQPMLIRRTAHAQANPVYFSVEPIAVAPLTDINVSANGLETPPTPSPVGQNFTVEIHLRNATSTNIRTGVWGAEVHLYFGNILKYAVPTGFACKIGQANWILIGLSLIYGISPGFYDASGNLVSNPPYASAVYFEIAVATASGPWYGMDGLVATIDFRIVKQPQGQNGEPTVTLPLTNDFTDLADSTSSSTNHGRVQGTLSIDATPGQISRSALPLAVNYSVRNYNATVGLIPEVPGSSTYWLYSDNFLACYALWRYDPSNSTLANIVTNISNTISKYIQTVPNPLNQYMVLNSSIAAFNASSDYTIAQYGNTVINITLNNGTGALNPSDYADIAFLEALYYHSIGQVQNASDVYQIGARMFDGKGLNDTVFQNGLQKGQYQTFKLALYVYVSKVLGQQFSPNAETTLLKMQAGSGGFYTGYDENQSTNGTNTNVETTSLAILALLEPSGRTIHIRAYGSIDPPTAPIFSADNITYTLTGNITTDSDGIVIERDNIVLNGVGYTVAGSSNGATLTNGITLANRSNVTVNSMTIENFTWGIWLDSSSNNTLSGNNVTNSAYGIELNSSSDNDVFSGNNVANNYGIMLDSSSNNILSGNNAVNNKQGIDLNSSSSNTLSGNNVTANDDYGIWFSSSSSNALSGNNAANNNYGIWLDSSSNNILSGNNVTANNYYGIWLSSSSSNTLSINNAANNNYGIVLNSSSNNTLPSNNVKANGLDGISLFSSSDNVVSGNNLANNGRDGIGLDASSNNNSLSDNNVTSNLLGFQLSFSSNNTFSGNMMASNGYNFDVEGSVLSDFLQSIDTSNLVNGKPVYYFVNQSNTVVSSDAYPQIGYLGFVNCVNMNVQGINLTNNYQGILLEYTNDSKITGNNLAHNRYGIELGTSSGNTLSDNNATNNMNGILLDNSSNNTLSGNNITNDYVGIFLDSSSNNALSGNNVTASNRYGIYLYSSSDNNTLSGNNLANNYDGFGLYSLNNTLFGNSVANNTCGIYLLSSDNFIIHNNFVGNAKQVIAFASLNETWDNGFPSGGNFWSDYHGSDSNHDGIGDLNYTIYASSVDRYPLMGTFNSFSASYEQSVETVCNSTISGFDFNGTAISFTVSGDPGSTGFCRICIPTALMNGSYNVFVNGTQVAYTLLPFSNGTYKYLYFSYTHSRQQVIIVPEASTLTILLLLTVLSSLMILSAKKRTRKRLT